MAQDDTIPSLGLKAIMIAAVVAGLVAGAGTALFHFALTEPLIDQAIALEEALAAGHDTGPPVVSREVQRVGLFVGLMLYGVFWAMLFGLAVFFGRRALPWSSRLAQGMAFGLLGAWCLGVLPFLKYPANPPGVGDPETIVLRQTLFLSFLTLSLGGAGVALAAWHVSARRFQWSTWQRALSVLGGYGLFVAVLLIALPANPDPVHLPMELVERFRLLSLAGMGFFWLMLGLVFGLILHWRESRSGAQPLVEAPAVPPQGI